jgi:hypothetical protein
MPGSTADVSAYRSVKFKFFVLNPTPCGVYCCSLSVVQSVFSGPRGGKVAAAPVLPVGYVVNASWIADRRMILAGYRLADLLTRVIRTFD